MTIKDDYSPLMSASESGRTEVVMILVNEDADLEAENVSCCLLKIYYIESDH